MSNLKVTGMQRTAATLAERFPNRVEKRVVVDVKFDDAKVRRQVGDGFDGRERVFARVPDGAGFRDVALEYRRSFDGVDLHGGILPVDLDKQAVRARGIAFYAETNVGRVWLQDYRDDTFVRGGAFDTL